MWILSHAAAPRAFGQERGTVAEDIPTVLFLLPFGESEDREASLRSALEAQFAGFAASITFERFASPVRELREQARVARELLRQRGDRAAFWLEAAGDEWLLYLAEPGAERILVRRFEMDAASPSAAEEVVSVVARQSTAALLSGHTIGMQTVELAPASVPAPVEPPPPSGTPPQEPPRDAAPPRRPASPAPWAIAFDVAYAGNTFAQQESWQSGLRLGGRWMWGRGAGPFVDVGYVFYHSVSAASGSTSVEVQRHPIEAGVGFRFTEGAVGLGLEVGYVGDVLSRSTTSDQSDLTSTPDATRLVSAVAPRVLFDLALSDHMAVAGSGGVEVLMNPFDFVVRMGDEDRTVLNPHSIRASARLGLSFRP